MGETRLYKPYTNAKPFKSSKTKSSVQTLPATNKFIISQFVSPDGTPTASSLNLPTDITHEQLLLLLNNLLQNDEQLPYSFTVNDTEITSDLTNDILIPQKVSSESVLTIVYQPQSIFKVNAMTRCSSTLTGHTEAILSVVFSPDGSKIATGSGDTTVRIYDLLTETPLATCKGHKNWVQNVAWSPNNAVLASAGMEHSVRLWNTTDGSSLGELKGHTNCITSLCWEPMHLNKDCNRFASASKDGTVRVWDSRLRKTLLTLASHTAPVTCVKWGGGGWIYTASRDKSIKLWDGKDGKLIRTLSGHAHWVNHISLSTDYLLKSGPYDPNTSATIGCPIAFRTPEAAYEAAVARYAAHGQDEMLASCSDDFTIFLWNPTKDKKPIARMTGHQQLVNCVAFSPDGRWLASAGFDKAVKLWDARTGGFITTLRGHVGAVYQVSFSPDSRLLLSASKDSTCKVWSLRTKKLEEDLPGHADEVFSVDWCPMGWGGASGGKDKTLKIWKH